MACTRAVLTPLDANVPQQERVKPSLGVPRLVVVPPTPLQDDPGPRRACRDVDAKYLSVQHPNGQGMTKIERLRRRAAMCGTAAPDAAATAPAPTPPTAIPCPPLPAPPQPSVLGTPPGASPSSGSSPEDSLEARSTPQSCGPVGYGRLAWVESGSPHHPGSPARGGSGSGGRATTAYLRDTAEVCIPQAAGCSRVAFLMRSARHGGGAVPPPVLEKDGGTSAAARGCAEPSQPVLEKDGEPGMDAPRPDANADDDLLAAVRSSDSDGAASPPGSGSRPRRPEAQVPPAPIPAPPPPEVWSAVGQPVTAAPGPTWTAAEFTIPPPACTPAEALPDTSDAMLAATSCTARKLTVPPPDAAAAWTPVELTVPPPQAAAPAPRVGVRASAAPVPPMPVRDPTSTVDVRASNVAVPDLAPEAPCVYAVASLAAVPPLPCTGPSSVTAVPAPPPVAPALPAEPVALAGESRVRRSAAAVPPVTAPPPPSQPLRAAGVPRARVAFAPSAAAVPPLNAPLMSPRPSAMEQRTMEQREVEERAAARTPSPSPSPSTRTQAADPDCAAGALQAEASATEGGEDADDATDSAQAPPREEARRLDLLSAQKLEAVAQRAWARVAGRGRSESVGKHIPRTRSPSASAGTSGPPSVPRGAQRQSRRRRSSASSGARRQQSGLWDTPPLPLLGAADVRGAATASPTGSPSGASSSTAVPLVAMYLRATVGGVAQDIKLLPGATPEDVVAAFAATHDVSAKTRRRLVAAVAGVLKQGADDEGQQGRLG